jgi:peroxiredoxin
MRAPYRMLVVACAVGLAACGARFEAKPAPAVTFGTVQGEKIASESLRGKVVLVNFWATDCPVCLKEMPRLVETHRKFQARGFETVAVAMWYDPPIRVTQYLERSPLPFKVAFDPVGEHARAFGEVTLTPTTFVIDKRGMIVSRIVGEPDFAKLHKLLEEKIAEAG